MTAARGVDGGAVPLRARAPEIAACIAFVALAAAPREWTQSAPAVVSAAAAAAGAYLLARRAGLAAGGAVIAAASFGGSGVLLFAPESGAAHVAWTLPWALLGLELCRAARRATGVALAACALLLGARGGDGATAVFVFAAASSWAIGLAARDPRAGRAALLACFAGAFAGAATEWSRFAWPAAERALVEPDWLALGLEVLALAVAVRFVARSERDGALEPVRALAAAAGMLLLGALLAQRGLPAGARVLFFPDVFGGAGRGAWRGPGDWFDSACAWVPFAALALALAAMLSPARADRARLGGRGVALALAVVASLLALRAPGAFELLERPPGCGASANVGAAAVAALFLGLLAGEGFESSTRTARAAAAVLLAGWAGLALLEPADARAPGVADPSDELVAFTARPPAEIEGGSLAMAGWIDPELDVRAAIARAQRVGPDGATYGRVREAPVELADAPRDAPPEGARAPRAGARFFRADGPRASDLEPGTWRVTLELHGADGRPIGERVAAIAHLVRRPRPSRLSLFFAAAGLLALLVLPRGAAGVALVLVLVVGQSLDVRRGADAGPPPASAGAR